MFDYRQIPAIYNKHLIFTFFTTRRQTHNIHRDVIDNPENAIKLEQQTMNQRGGDYLKNYLVSTLANEI